MIPDAHTDSPSTLAPSHWNGVVKGLIKLNQSLEQEFSTLQQEYVDSKRSLEKTLDDLRAEKAHAVQSGKMASLGSLAAGLAHEVNTPVGLCVTLTSRLAELLTNIKVSIDTGTVKRSTIEAFFSNASESVHILETNLQRTVNLIKDFQALTGDQYTQKSVSLNFHQHLHDILYSLNPETGKYPHLITVKSEGDWHITTYPMVWEHIISNLLTNALRHAYDAEQQGTIQLYAEKDDTSVTLIFNDDGKSMSEETKQYIYEPFFATTRGKGGSGLGMHVVFNAITQKLGGTITCTSSGTNGTAFCITVPLRNPSISQLKREISHVQTT